MLLKLLFDHDGQLLAPVKVNQGLDEPIGGMVRLQIVMLFANISCEDMVMNANAHPAARIPERRSRKRICCSNLIIERRLPEWKTRPAGLSYFPGLVAIAEMAQRTG